MLYGIVVSLYVVTLAVNSSCHELLQTSNLLMPHQMLLLKDITRSPFTNGVLAEGGGAMGYHMVIKLTGSGEIVTGRF